MNKRFLLIFSIVVLAMPATAQSPKALWIWYPGDFELWLSSNIQVERTERGVFYPPFWRMDRHTPLITFSKTVELEQDETVDIRVEGSFNLKIDGRFVYDNKEQILLPKGKHDILFLVYNTVTPPSVWVRGKTFVSDKTWKVSTQNKQSVQADAWIFDEPENKPSAYALATTPLLPASADVTQQSAFVDFGKETFGYLKLHGLKGKGTITARYGESEAEAKSGEQAETWDVFEISQSGEADFTSDKSNAFRYVHLTWDGDIRFDRVSMLYEYLPVEYKGAFRCSDDEINKIWEVAAYTLHLSSRAFFLDGIKRDRWIWSGDAYQSYLMNFYLFFDNPLVKRTVWALRGSDPVETHINTILDYSFYWFMGIYDYYQYTGDKEFVQQIYPRMLTLMDFCLGRRNAEGLVEGLPGDWVFIDWAPIDKEGEVSVEQLLLCRSLETMALCAGLMDDTGNASKYRLLADDLKKKIQAIFWDPEQKALVHSRKNGKPDKTVTKYANMFALTFDYLNDRQQEDVKNNVLLNDRIQKITTPYMRFYELEALCRIKQQKHVLHEIKDYWGGMLRLGATSFWEAYDPTESGVQHYAMYDRPFGKSLCHAWGASPLYLFGKYYLGVTPTGPGYETYLVEPELGGLKWMKGAVPTPAGTINLHVTEKTITVETVAGKGTLRFRSSRKPACKSAAIRSTASGQYEMGLEPNQKYEVRYSAVEN
ncbi:MAG: alpha-rhamnosidase [Tannerella sp.]|jgi:hypothetical protein|nr:alpha-rhamnosidase [Tannerella sp.]